MKNISYRLWFCFSEVGRIIVGIPKGARIQTLFITDGKTTQLTGQCMFFTRLRTDVEVCQRTFGDVMHLFNVYL